MLILAFFNQKGGVGKTSVATNLAASFASSGLQTLLVDLDAQANATQYLHAKDLSSSQKTVSDFFEASLGLGLFSSGLRDITIPTSVRNLSLIPADGRLIELQTKLEARYKIFKLRDAILDLGTRMQLDVVLLDCPPALNFYSMSALMAAQKVYIPFDCDAFAVNGLKDVMAVVEEIKEDHNASLQIGGVIANHYIASAKQPTQAIKNVESMGLKVMTPYLSSSVVMRESHDARLPLVAFSQTLMTTQKRPTKVGRPMQSF
jgi:chromosome partitioning protein